jgi:hypothetical protein
MTRAMTGGHWMWPCSFCYGLASPSVGSATGGNVRRFVFDVRLETLAKTMNFFCANVPHLNFDLPWAHRPIAPLLTKWANGFNIR